jgi:sulfite exporter TauE/SafE
MTLDWLVLGGALLTGLLGGAHCAAMCGGIATSLSIGQRSGWWIAAQPNLGRIAGYTIAGALAGGIGQAVLDVAQLPWLIVASRAAVGIVLVLVALRLLDHSGRLSFLAVPGARIWQHLRPLQRRLLPPDTAGKRIGLGVLWGWMPCGLSTQLLVAAWLQASAWHGALTMLAFGLATLPVMLPLTWAGARVGQRLQRGGWRVASAMVVLFAGVVTLAGPWLMQVPALHGALQALGCRSVA